MKRFSLFLALGLFLRSSVSLAAGESQCAVSSASGVYLPSTGTVKALAIFIKFKDDTFDAPPITNGWPSSLNTLPSWAPNFLAPTVGSPYTPDGMTDFFDEMSFGQFKLIGDVHPVVYITPQNQSYYSASNLRGIGFLNKQILQDLDSAINYANYDNLDPLDTDGDGNKNEPDGEVDMIFMVYRAWDKNLMQRFYQGGSCFR